MYIVSCGNRDIRRLRSLDHHRASETLDFSDECRDLQHVSFSDTTKLLGLAAAEAATMTAVSLQI
ncbi:hypothetical protein TIFTF001_049238 [Ficus carica]|uniref:Uncharacterized protein n=1 Tax=Ficus carica TaxID=3494 RepID=A0AA88CPE8_FICCA|nr:hypothetical protein TIFTF001_049238 [Ficus carica]